MLFSEFQESQMKYLVPTKKHYWAIYTDGGSEGVAEVFFRLRLSPVRRVDWQHLLDQHRSSKELNAKRKEIVEDSLSLDDNG
jgi:hypothetical protein